MNWKIVTSLLGFAVMAVCGDPAWVKITEPANSAKVAMRPVVRGQVWTKDASVVLVVHPTETGDFWVQPPIKVEKDGSWQTRPYVGRAEDTGKGFEIRAVAAMKLDLKEGQVLSDWPAAAAQSPVVAVTRE